MPGVVGAKRLAAACGQERLPVRAGHVGGPEQGGERLALLGIDQRSQGLAVGVLAQVPACGPGELAVAGYRAGVGHAGQAEVGGVGQHGGEHDARVIGRHPGV